jgi:glycosyltransferase involved in cell wall biosynthesis
MVNFDQEYDVYVTSEIGTFSVGGVSFWVDNWIRYVVPYLRVTPILIIEVEPSPGWTEYARQNALVLNRPGTEHKFEWKYPTSSIKNYFSLPTTTYTDKIIKNARKVHLLSCPLAAVYGRRTKDIIKKYGNIDSVIIHSSERESTDVIKKYFHVRRSREIFDSNQRIEFHEGLNEVAKEPVWIGVNERKEIGLSIPNFYKFEYNLKATDSNVVGYAARSEPRKNFHYLQNIESIALTAHDIIQVWETIFKKKIKFENVKVKPYSREKVEDFYNSSDWGIFHGAYESEPFGYSIFQAIDYGKIPIISKDWCKDMNYPFRAGSVKEFENQVAKIKELSLEERDSYLQQLKTYLSKFSSETEWRDELLTIYNRTEKETWLPGKLQPSI